MKCKRFLFFLRFCCIIKIDNRCLFHRADGSGVNIPTTKENLEEFGTSSRKGTKPQASIGLGCLYDVMDRGYPSTAAFIRMMEKGILFLARLKSSDYKKSRLLWRHLGMLPYVW